MPKEYGKLTADQFRTLIRRLPELRGYKGEVEEALANVPRERLNAILQGGFNWGAIYEFSFPEHLAIAVVAFNLLPMLNEAMGSPDPQQYVLDHLEAPDDSTHPDFTEQDLLGVLLSIQRTILSVMLFQRTLSGLVEDVRERGDLDSMFKAIRVDRMAMFCPTFADRIARAEIERDRRFFLRLQNALKGPSQKHWQAYCDLRYSLFVLRELGFDGLSDTELSDLLIHKLKVYPDHPGAQKALRKHYHLSKKLPTT